MGDVILTNLHIGDPNDPEWQQAVRTALDSYAARAGGGDAMKAQFEDGMRWAFEGQPADVVVARLLKVNEALLRIGVTALALAPDAFPGEEGATTDYQAMLDAIRRVMENNDEPGESFTVQV